MPAEQLLVGQTCRVCSGLSGRRTWGYFHEVPSCSARSWIRKIVRASRRRPTWRWLCFGQAPDLPRPYHSKLRTRPLARRLTSTDDLAW